jgi:hypothetical protein
MAAFVYQYVATIPADTTEAAPYVVPVPLDGFALESIDLEVPAGAAGLVGFYIANNGVPTIPQGPSPWIIWDNHADTWFFTDQPNASGWAIVGYNTGFFAHTVTTRWHVNSALADGQPAAVPLTIVTSNVAELPTVVL